MLFFIVFFSIYLSMHIFVWFRFVRQLTPVRKTVILGYILCMAMALTPLLAHQLPLTLPEILVYSFWQITFTWLAVIFYLFVFQAITLMLQIIMWPFIRKIWPELSSRVAVGIIASCILVVGYGFFEASKPLKTVNYEFESQKIKHDIRLIFISDLHLGVQKSSNRLKKLIETVEKHEADLIIFGGDVVNDHLEWMDDEALQLSRLTVPYDKHGVLGNHEFYPGLDKSIELFEQAGINILDNKNRLIEKFNLNLVGVTDPTPYLNPREHQEFVIMKLLENIDTEQYNILISHRPWGFEHAAQAGIDLHLSGHTHNGQIFPFRYFVRMQFDHVYGLYEKGKSKLIVSCGAGSWGPPIRVFSPAEILIVDIISR
ncbi:MAG: metallophosphoesterase [Desulfonatronovibrio sp.]